ncbi:hypothetical protein [Steroidobacter sp.]|uniref:ATP-dependent DNA ligase n=1 Tax=Steroidobacter sp. TaxID=1978227 RepID=UPI001A3E71E2|nr:hypothetical protein [Steroidobacter sp.]MBL8267972.1 hypothetical protein [Steroidobacter sp.]
MLSQPARRLPIGPDWLYEPCLDGIRVVIIKRGASVTLCSAEERQPERRFPFLLEAAAKIPVDDAIIDGAVVEPTIARAVPSVRYYAFDLMRLEGRDLRGQRLMNRREALRTVISNSGLFLAEELTSNPRRAVEQAMLWGFPGVVAKRRDSAYRSGARSQDWQEYRPPRQLEFVVGGYKPAGPDSVAALLVGCVDGPVILYSGLVHQGIVGASRLSLKEALAPLETARSPFINLWGEHEFSRTGPKRREAADVIWLRPTLKALLRVAEWTPHQLLKAPTLVELRTRTATPSEGTALSMSALMHTNNSF